MLILVPVPDTYTGTGIILVKVSDDHRSGSYRYLSKTSALVFTNQGCTTESAAFKGPARPISFFCHCCSQVQLVPVDALFDTILKHELWLQVEQLAHLLHV